MSRRNVWPQARQDGFTLVELIVVMVLTGIITVAAYTFFNTSFSQYLSLQKEGTTFTDLALQSQRLANVLRGATDITAATDSEVTCYAYFAPSDKYVSTIRYYKTADNNKLLADVTRMTSNPPLGTPIAGSTKTFTIIPAFYQAAGVKTFVYLDAAGSALTMPITDLKTIKGMQVNLAVPGGTSSDTTNQAVSLQVSLRNRKVNL